MSRRVLLILDSQLKSAEQCFVSLSIRLVLLGETEQGRRAKPILVSTAATCHLPPASQASFTIICHMEPWMLQATYGFELRTPRTVSLTEPTTIDFPGRYSFYRARPFRTTSPLSCTVPLFLLISKSAGSNNSGHTAHGKRTSPYTPSGAR